MKIVEASEIMLNNGFNRLPESDILTWYKDLRDFRVFVSCAFEFNKPDEIASFDLYFSRVIGDKIVKVDVCNDKDIRFILRVIRTFQDNDRLRT